MSFDLCSELAKYEVGWWKAHHRKDNDKFMENMTKLCKLQLGIPYDKAEKAAKYRVEAAYLHDIAEDNEDKGGRDNKEKSDEYWKKTQGSLERYFEILGYTDDFAELAKHEVGWWKAHHRKDKHKLVEDMAKLYELQFNISYSDGLKAVDCRVKATKTHDTAEYYEDKGGRDNKEKSDEYWKKTEELLKKHFEILLNMT